MAKTRGGLRLRSSRKRSSRNPVDIPSTSLAVNTRKRKGVESDRVQQSSISIDRLKSTFQTKSRPFQLIKLIRGFNEKQKTSVREIGFGGLLSLKLSKNPTTMFGWLVDSFDPGSCMFCIDSLKCFPISEHDVYDVFCLPLNQNKDIEVVSRCANKYNPDFPLKQEFRSFFGFEDTNASIPLELLERLIPKMTDGGDEFKQLFVLHASSSLLAPTHNRTVDLKIVKAIVDPDKISTFNWCKYVLDHLCDSVVRYRKGKLKFFCGCVILLEIVYFHRLKFKNISLPSSLPLISHWTDKDVSKRIKEELSAHHFGNGIILTTYPISESMIFESGQALGVKVNHIDVGHPSSSEQAFRDQPPQNDEKIEFQLPLNAMRNSDIRQLAGDEIYELLLLMRRDTQVVSNFYMEKIKYMLDQKHSTSSLPVPQLDVATTSSTPFSQTQQFFMNPTVLNTIDEIIDTVKWVTSIPEMMNEDIIAGEGNGQVNEGVGQVNEGDDVMGDIFLDNVDTVELDKVVEDVVNVVSNNSLIFESHGFENVFSYGRAKCSIPYRGIVDKLTYVSHLMKSNKKYMRTLGLLLQEVVDYCFVYDKCFDSSELLVNFDDYLRIQREEFCTLGDPSKLTHVNVVDCWCLLLNENEKNKESFKRFFFSASSSLALLDFDMNGGSERIDTVCKLWVEWVNFNKADLMKFDLIVVPILKGSQYFLLLLNMELRIVQWIDNVNHTAISEQQIKKLGDTMKDLLSTIFDEKMQFTNVIPLWKIERVSTDWKTTARTNIESDVFTMISMLFFEGTTDFRCAQLNAAPLRHVARAKIVGSLLLSDFNKQRSKVLDELSNFKDKRRAIAKQVSIRRVKIR